MVTKQLTTNGYRLQMAKQFAESFTEQANTIYYMFAGKTSPYPGGVVQDLYDTFKTTQFDAYNSMLFGKHIQETDIAYMIKKNAWTSGTVYDMYDDEDPNLEAEQNFFVVVDEGTTYYVYKCLYNNNDSPSTEQPTFADTSAQDEYYETSDGYIWKYMFQMSSSTYDKFNTSNYIPFDEDSNVTGNAVPGSIDVIITVDQYGVRSTISGSGYDNYYTDTFNDPLDFTNNPSGQSYCRLGNSASKTASFYNGCYLIVVDGTAVGEYGKITSHFINTSGTWAYMDRAFATTPDNTSEYQITPSVVILNSSNDPVYAEARALVDANTANSIYKVEVLNRGSGIFGAAAYVFAANQVGVSNTATLRVIASPRGGHGSDPLSELFCSRVGVTTTFANSQSNTITTDGDYRTVGILRDPMFANVVFNISSENGTFQVGESVSQTYSGKTAYGIVENIGVGTVKVSNTVGFFTTGYTIVGNTSSANAQVDTIINNGVAKQFDTFSQLYRYEGTYVTATKFTEHETVYQANVAIANAVFHSNNSSGNTVYLSEKLGPLYSSNTLTGNSSGAIFNINTSYEPDLVMESGDILYLENFDAVNRSNTQSETIKLILEF